MNRIGERRLGGSRRQRAGSRRRTTWWAGVGAVVAKIGARTHTRRGVCRGRRTWQKAGRRVSVGTAPGRPGSGAIERDCSSGSMQYRVVTDDCSRRAAGGGGSHERVGTAHRTSRSTACPKNNLSVERRCHRTGTDRARTRPRSPHESESQSRGCPLPTTRHCPTTTTPSTR